MTEHEEKAINMWIGARWGLRSGIAGGAIAGIVLGVLAGVLVLLTDLQFSGLEIFSVFWLAAVYGFLLGVIAGALGGLIAGALVGATQIPDNLPRAGAIAGGVIAVLLNGLFFLTYAWLNEGEAPVALLLDIAPVALIAALGGILGGYIAGRRFDHYYDLRPTYSAFEHSWDE